GGREEGVGVDRADGLGEGRFIGVEGERYVGLLEANQWAPGQIRHAVTGVAPDRRRRGIATALKRAALADARARGAHTLRSFVRPRQEAILALDEKLGFARRGSSVTLEKCLVDVAAVDPAIYDGYVGRYESPPAAPWLVTKEDGRLFAESIGQKVELFPRDERRFFIKWYHGVVEFEPPSGAEAPRLRWRYTEAPGKEVVVCAQRVV